MDAQVSALLAKPPKPTVEELGFYPSGEEGPFECVFRKTISNLEAHRYLHEYEDKYISEFLALWLKPLMPDTASRLQQWCRRCPQTCSCAKNGFLAKDRLSAATLAYITMLEEAFDEADESQVRDGFLPAVRDIEACLSATGQALLSFDLDGGDTLFAFVLPLERAERWRNVLFEKTDNATLGTRQFMWPVFASFLEYALDLELGLEFPKELDFQPLRPLSEVGFKI